MELYPRHLLRGVREDVGDDPHGGLRRVDIGVADHELLEDVVLDGPRQLLRRHTLLLRRDDVERQHRQHRAVHRHRDRHPVQRDAVEELPHVVERVDRHARHPDIARHPRMVAVVAPVGGQIEGDGQALLTGGQVAPVEGVGLLGGGEPRVLADRPGLVDVHRRIRAPQIRRDSRIGLQEVEPPQILVRVERLDRDALGRVPVQLRDLAPGPLRDRLAPLPGGALGGFRAVQADGREVGHRAPRFRVRSCRPAAHASTPMQSRREVRRATASPPAWTNPSVPYPVAHSASPGRPASSTRVAPAARSAAATSAACSA